MFKSVLAIAAVLSVSACVAYDVLARMQLAEKRREIASAQAELRTLAGMDKQVMAFRQQKDDLQKRIDLINQVRQVEHTTADAVSMLNELGSQAAQIESVSIVDAKKIVVHGRAESERLIDTVAARLGLHVTFEAKR
jgi:Tfp pilus assembly protein PilN